MKTRWFITLDDINSFKLRNSVLKGSQGLFRDLRHMLSELLISLQICKQVFILKRSAVTHPIWPSWVLRSWGQHINHCDGIFESLRTWALGTCSAWRLKKSNCKRDQIALSPNVSTDSTALLVMIFRADLDRSHQKSSTNHGDLIGKVGKVCFF